MGSAEPIFEFKQSFTRKDAGLFIASVIQHKLVWDKLNEEEFLHEIIKSFSDKKELWTAAHICLFASGFMTDELVSLVIFKEKYLKDGSTGQINDFGIDEESNLTLEQLTSKAFEILVKQKTCENWQEFLDESESEKENQANIQKYVGTIYTIVYLLTDDRSGLLKALGNSSREYHQEILAFLIGCNPTLIDTNSVEIQNWLAEISIGKYQRVLESMSAFVEASTIEKLADSYLRKNPVEEKIQNTTNNSTATDALIEKIKLFKDYALLAKLGTNDQLFEQYSHEASNLGEKLSSSLEKLTVSQKNEKIRDGKFAGNLTEAIATLGKELGIDHPAVKLLQMVEIDQTDAVTARKLGKDVRNSILQSNSIRQIVPVVETEEVLGPVQIVQAYLDLDMVVEAGEITEKLTEMQPRNFQLLLQGAKLFYEFGDYEKAVEYLTRYGISKDLTREEKLILIEASTNLGLWREALDFWNTINLVSLEDYQKKAICAYRANDRESFLSAEEASKNFYKSNGLFGVLRGLFSLREGQTSAAQAEIEAVLSGGKRDRFTIQFIIEYYLAVTQPENALAWINSLSSLEKDFPEVCLMQYMLLNQAGDPVKSRKVLSSFIEKNCSLSLTIVEKLLKECINQSDPQNAENILGHANIKWPLSPTLGGYKAHLLIEAGQFLAAQDILIKLIQRKSVRENWVEDYALSKLERKQNTFPLDETTLGSDSAQVIHAFEKKIFREFPDNIALKIAAAEMDKQDRLASYQEILADDRMHHHPEIWRIHTGMGKHYYQNQKYDMALACFKEARKQQPKLQIINLYLINSLAKMKLFDEALDILIATIKENPLSIEEFLEINSNLKQSEQWLRMLKEVALENTDMATARIVLAQLYADNGKNEKVHDIISSIEFSKKSQVIERLISIQILIQAGFQPEAKRMLEFMLTSKKEVRKEEYLAGAFLYIQMQEYHKAANLLNLIEPCGYIESALKSELYRKLDLIKEAEASVQAAIQKLEEQNYGSTGNLIAWIKEPEMWATLKNDKVWVYLRSIEASLLNKDHESALEKAWLYIEQFPSDLRLSAMALNIINLFGDGRVPEAILDKLPDDLNGYVISDSICVYGEISLKQDHEIMAANLVSQCLESMPDSARVKALQARLLARNGNPTEAGRILDELLIMSSSIKGSSDDVLSNCPIWLAEAALELGRQDEALRICEEIFTECGITPECAKVFLTCLLDLSYDNWVNKQLNVTQHAKTISEQDRKFYEDILLVTDESIEENHDLKELAASSKVWQDLLNGQTEINIDAEAEELDKKTLLTAKYFAVGQNKSAHVIEEEELEREENFLMSLLLMDSQPDKAMDYLTEAMHTLKNDPRHYAALAFIQKNLGRYDDAYAAINLALSKWEDEYKWHLLAGELSQAAGDMHASLSHYQKASEIHKDEETQSYLGKINYQAGNRFGIAFLEDKLADGDGDYETLVKLGELGIKNGKYQKAAKYLERAISIDPQDVRSYVLMSKVAQKVGNFDKADEIIDQAMRLKSDDTDVLLQKIEVKESKHGPQSALEMIEALNENKAVGVSQIIVKKADLLASAEDRQSALQYLLDQSKKHDSAAIEMKLAQLYFEEGNTKKAEEAAEQVLQSDSNSPVAMSLLANIYSQNGDLDKALDFFVKSIQINPFRVEAYIDLARLHQSRRELSQAAVVLKNGLRSNPMNFDLLFALGLLYYQQGLYKESEDYLQQAATFDPNNENVKRLLSTLMNANIIHSRNIATEAIRMN